MTKQANHLCPNETRPLSAGPALARPSGSDRRRYGPLRVASRQSVGLLHSGAAFSYVRMVILVTLTNLNSSLLIWLHLALCKIPQRSISALRYYHENNTIVQARPHLANSGASADRKAELTLILTAHHCNLIVYIGMYMCSLYVVEIRHLLAMP